MLFQCQKIFVSHSKIVILADDLPISKMLVSHNYVPGPKFHRRSSVLIHRLSYPFSKTWIFVRTGIRTAHVSPIRNRHFDPIGTRSDSEISDLAAIFLPGSVVAGCRCNRIRTPIPSNGHNFPLGNRMCL
ncbi:hypothetical protein Taro_018417 [Colocasia esculenta]|uniref:Uncharacterized protein n=1 Tax=Colocasia esculenta TaxID=4460 RepID=A0A843UZ19_COLES|nr:hypothetical protein [Colocasia esculenta]